MILTALRAILISLAGVYSYTFFKDYKQVQGKGKLDNPSLLKVGALGGIANFFDTLGIGSFAIVVAGNKFFKLGIKDKELPGFLNVGCCLPVMCEAFIFTTVIEVDPLTLFSMLIAAAVGSYIGAGIISKMDEAKIQLVMGVALIATAVLMFCSKMGYMPGGGESIGLRGVNLAIGIVGNAVLGALMTAGVGLFAPCMALTYFLGLSPQVTFPIMMGSCAMLQPIASVRFIKEGAYPRKATLALGLCGIVGVFIAAYIVKSLPIDTLKWIVMGVLVYTGLSMMSSSVKNLGNRSKVAVK